MQLISAIVRPFKVAQVCNALRTFGVRGLTVTTAHGFAKGRGHREMYRGVDWSTGFQDQVKIEIVAPDEDVQDVINVICKVAATGDIGDGKIWVTPIGQLIRIHTGEVGIGAL